MATRSSVLAWRIPGTGSLVGCRLWGRTESDTTEVTQQSWLLNRSDPSPPHNNFPSQFNSNPQNKLPSTFSSRVSGRRGVTTLCYETWLRLSFSLGSSPFFFFFHANLDLPPKIESSLQWKLTVLTTAPPGKSLHLPSSQAGLARSRWEL